MELSWAALLEPILVFVGLIVFMHWQFRELDQRARARKEAAEAEARKAAEADSPPPAG